MSYTKPLHLFNRLKTRFVLLILVTVLVFGGPAVTLQVHTEARNTPESATNNTPEPVGRTTEPTAANPLQSQCVAGREQTGEFDPKGVVNLPTVPVHLSVLPNRKILFWGRDKTMVGSSLRDAVGQSFTYVWNMSDGSNKTDFADGALLKATGTSLRAQMAQRESINGASMEMCRCRLIMTVMAPPT